jgi:hypothetical protein
MSKQLDDWLGRNCLAGLLSFTVLVICIGCNGSGPTTSGASVGPADDEPAAPKGDAIPDPVLREARDEADAFLLDLLSGKFDQDENLSPVAEKVKGYTSWSIKSQTMARQGAAEFKGIVKSPEGSANFTMTLVKQTGGQWAVGTFSGPYR